MKTIDDANAAIEKLNDTVSCFVLFHYMPNLRVCHLTDLEFCVKQEIGGRKIKVNVTEKPLTGVNSSFTHFLTALTKSMWGILQKL
ncbi:hypothetical protein Hanom_Chr08g00710191 [Helianthus anomalus]